MRRTAFILLAISVPLLAQTPPRISRAPRGTPLADTAEIAVKQAGEQLGALKKACDRDVAVLEHLRTADGALADPMQPSNAVQKAYEEVQAAKGLGPEFLVYQGVVRCEHELESARLSPMTADFGRLRAVLRTDALGPASRVVIRDAVRIQDELQAWLRVQQLIADHVKTMSEISNQMLRASDQ